MPGRVILLEQSLNGRDVLKFVVRESTTVLDEDEVWVALGFSAFEKRRTLLETRMAL